MTVANKPHNTGGAVDYQKIKEDDFVPAEEIRMAVMAEIVYLGTDGRTITFIGGPLDGYSRGPKTGRFIWPVAEGDLTRAEKIEAVAFPLDLADCGMPARVHWYASPLSRPHVMLYGGLRYVDPQDLPEMEYVGGPMDGARFSRQTLESERSGECPGHEYSYSVHRRALVFAPSA